MTAASESDRLVGDELSTVERIRDAALKNFAAQGIPTTSLRTVAAAAGVSLGLVQHHFVTKAGLVKAVDDYVLQMIISAIAQPIPDPPADSVTEIGSRITSIVADQPDIADYLGRALVGGSPLGEKIFDTLAELGRARWEQRVERGETRPDVDLTWATINSLVLALGVFTLRAHVERHLPEPLNTPGQLHRWQDAVTTLLRDGLFQPADGT